MASGQMNETVLIFSVFLLGFHLILSESSENVVNPSLKVNVPEGYLGQYQPTQENDLEQLEIVALTPEDDEEDKMTRLTRSGQDFMFNNGIMRSLRSPPDYLHNNGIMRMG